MEFDELVGGIEFMSLDGLFQNNKLTISQNQMLKSIHENPFTIVYKRRQEGVSLWVVESKHIHASNPDDAAAMYEPANDKVYRHPTFYEIPDEVGHM